MGTSLEEKIAETMKFLGEAHVCGWARCDETVYGDSHPPGWMRLTLCKYQRQREVILCPKHGVVLERELKTTGELEGR